MHRAMQAWALAVVIVGSAMMGCCGGVPPGFFVDETLERMLVSQMQQVFVVRDGSVISNPVDGVVLDAIYRELLVMSSRFKAMGSLQDMRNSTAFPDSELVRFVLLGIMGNFHAQTLKDADVYNDVQVVYNPVDQRFITKQNMRDTEIVVFQTLLIICVFGLFLVFSMQGSGEASGKVVPEDGKESAPHLSGKIVLPTWASHGRGVHHRAGITASLG